MIGVRFQVAFVVINFPSHSSSFFMLLGRPWLRAICNPKRVKYLILFIYKNSHPNGLPITVIIEFGLCYELSGILNNYISHDANQTLEELDMIHQKCKERKVEDMRYLETLEEIMNFFQADKLREAENVVLSMEVEMSHFYYLPVSLKIWKKKSAKRKE